MLSVSLKKSTSVCRESKAEILWLERYNNCRYLYKQTSGKATCAQESKRVKERCQSEKQKCIMCCSLNCPTATLSATLPFIVICVLQHRLFAVPWSSSPAYLLYIMGHLLCFTPFLLLWRPTSLHLLAKLNDNCTQSCHPPFNHLSLPLQDLRHQQTL